MNIEKLSLPELKALAAKVDAQIPVARARELDAARKELTALAQARGFTLRDLREMHEPRTQKRQRKASVQLRDPKGLVWAGRGRMPKGFDRSRAETIA